MDGPLLADRVDFSEEAETFALNPECKRKDSLTYSRIYLLTGMLHLQPGGEFLPQGVFV